MAFPLSGASPDATLLFSLFAGNFAAARAPGAVSDMRK
jgi:hypothetical protein